MCASWWTQSVTTLFPEAEVRAEVHRSFEDLSLKVQLQLNQFRLVTSSDPASLEASLNVSESETQTAPVALRSDDITHFQLLLKTEFCFTEDLLSFE